MAARAESPPRVPLALTLGVTGHRASALPPSALPAIERRVADVIGRLKAATERIAQSEAQSFADCAPAFIIVSPMADGADQIVTEAALRQGFSLQAVLPFARGMATSMSDSDETMAALGQASSVLELPGREDDTLDAFVMAGRATVAHCDILVAVWDGLPPRGRGGTGEVVELAIAKGTPVIHVPVDDQSPVAILWSAFDPHVVTLRGEPAASQAFNETTIDRLLKALIAPPSDRREREFLGRFHGERARKWRLRFEYPALMALAGAGSIRAHDWRDADCAIAATEEWQRYRGACAGPHGIQAALDLLEHSFVWSDRLANRYAQYYRSGHVFNFSLAAVAGVVGLSGLIVRGGEIVLPIIEFGLVLAIIANTRVGLRQEWHRRWLDYRQLAERLRPLRSLKLLAVAAPDPPGSAANPIARRWVDWYAGAVWRALACPEGSIRPDGVVAIASAICGHEIEPQIAYHRTGAERLSRFDAWLEKLGMALFLATIALCLGGLGAALWAPHWAERMGDVFVFFSASLPVVGGALFGIRVQGDFHGSAARSMATAQELEQIGEHLGRNDITLNRAADLVEQAARAMFADLGEWHLINAQYDLAVG